MDTIYNKLKQLNDLYQKQVKYNRKLTEKISQYRKLEIDKISLEHSLQCNRMLFSGMIAVILAILSTPILGMGYVFFGFGEIGAIILLESKGFLKKIACKFSPKKYAELEQLNRELEKVNIEQLKQQSKSEKEKELQIHEELTIFQTEAEKLVGVPSEEEIRQEYQRQLEERNKQIEEFFQNHTLTDPELSMLNNATDKMKVKYAERKTDKIIF